MFRLPAARRVAEALEKDMASNLATKGDLMLVRQELEHLGQDYGNAIRSARRAIQGAGRTV